MAAYDSKVLDGEHLGYLVQLIKNSVNGVAADIPDSLDDLTDDATHRLVTDAEKTTWNGKANAADIPTVVSALTNDSGYQTAAQVQAAIAASGHMGNSEIVSALPQVADALPNKIYLVSKTGATGSNIYDEWMLINGAWEKLGDTQIDIEALSNTEIQTIWDNVQAS